MLTEVAPPQSNELEISIFGPGRGECVLIHLGNNDWCVVDSCIARGSNAPVALEYLDGFRNDALQNIRLVVATHWHDDHIGGLAALLSRAPNAAFSCSMALECPEFQTLISAAPQNIAGRSGVEEFAAILRELEARGKRAPIFAIQNRQILSLAGAGRPFPITLESLSPSDRSVRVALTEIGALIPRPGEPQRRIVNRSPNHTSAVIWVAAGPVRVLLGADLEHSTRTDQGWTAVLTCHRDNIGAQLFKVPHHGSRNGDNDTVWQQMMQPNPIAVITPFAGGSVRLPKISDCQRLLGRTKNLYCTAFGLGKPPVRDRLVDRMMKEQISDRQILSGKPGHVRVRWPVGDQVLGPSIETFNGAYQVTRDNSEG